MVFDLCKLAGVPVWHIDVLKTESGRVDIVLIKDEANEVAPNKGPRIEVKPLGEKLEDTVEQPKGLIRLHLSLRIPVRSSLSRVAPLL